MVDMLAEGQSANRLDLSKIYIPETPVKRKRPQKVKFVLTAKPEKVRKTQV